MDQGSSPHLPSGSLATNKSYGSSESLLIGKKFQSFDDSSSVTSMSSASRATYCMACKGEGSSVKVLIMCIRCKRMIHPGCANPYIDDYKATWTCQRCKKDQAQTAKKMLTSAFGDSQNSTKLATPSYTSPYAHSNPGPSSVHSEPLKESAKPSGIKPGIECEIVGCSTPIFYLPSGSRPLCTKHRIEKQSASAKAAAPKPAAPVSRSFNKDKLYPPKKDDKQYLKRKRPAAKRSNSGNHQDMGQESPTTFTFQPPEKQFTFKAPEPLRHPPTPTRPSPRSAFRRTPERKGKQASMAKSPTEVEQAVDDLNRSLGSASMAESPIEPVSAWQGNLFSRSNSARATPQVLAQDSPDYSPPPPQVADDDNPWTGIVDRDDSPGSQIAHELAATASQQDASEVDDSLEFGRAGLPSIEEEIAAGHVHPYKPPQVRDQADEDEEMLDPDSLALIDRLASEHPSSPGKSASPPAHRPLSSPSSSTYSENVSSDAEEEQDPPSDPASALESEARHDLLIDTSDAALSLNSIEEIRAQRAANFDTTELDSFLFKQAQPESDEQPTSKELLSTQIWGHIDPRVAWPRKMTPEETKEKIKEIEARGGKKANFGKILTAQVRKERADKGWHIHQASEKRSEEECKEMDRRLEELFGKEGLGNCVPGIRDGRLVMIEQLEPEETQTGPSRRKRRREPKMYPVMGGQ